MLVCSLRSCFFHAKTRRRKGSLRSMGKNGTLILARREYAGGADERGLRDS